MLLKKALQNLFRKPVATLDNNVAPSVITIDVNLSKKIDTILEQLIEKTHTKKLNILTIGDMLNVKLQNKENISLTNIYRDPSGIIWSIPETNTTNKKNNVKRADNIDEYLSSLESEFFDVILISDHQIICDDNNKLKSIVCHILTKTKILLMLSSSNDTEDLTQTYTDYEKLLDNANFYNNIYKSSNILYFASNKFVYVNNSLYKIEHYHNSFNGMRRAYLCGNMLIKFLYKNKNNRFGIKIEDCIKELHAEIKNCALGLSFSPSIEYVDETTDLFISILRLNRIGVHSLTLDINNYQVVNDNILDIFDNLIELENKGLYHYDITPWNIMVDQNNKAFLIDVGAIIPANCLGSAFNSIIFLNQHQYYNTYDAFICIIYDLLTSNADRSFQMKTLNCYIPSIFYNQEAKIPEEYKNFFIKFQSINRAQLNFTILKEMFIKYVVNKSKLNLTKDEEIVYGLVYEKRKQDEKKLDILLYKNINSTGKN
ncbi:MAG: hypothetical protein IJY99_00505 [Alphaproteobacteria bacterium]|nr:hypothetical protein [Alphaproteobacteria bacterium]